MLIIESFDTVSLVFSGDFGQFLTGLTIVMENNTTKVETIKTFKSVLLSNSRYTEFEIDWASSMKEGEYKYNLLLNESTILEQGMLRVFNTEITIPVYKNDMDEYKIYKN